jgi:hypothetical protein
MRGPYRPYKPWKHTYDDRPNLFRQILLVLVAIIGCIALVIIGDMLLHPGIDWSDTLIVRMIYERRNIGR